MLKDRGDNTRSAIVDGPSWHVRLLDLRQCSGEANFEHDGSDAGPRRQLWAL